MQTKRNLCVKLAGVTAVLTLLSACQTSSFGTAEHIDFRAERFEDLRVVADFNDCKNDGLIWIGQQRRAKISRFI